MPLVYANIGLRELPELYNALQVCGANPDLPSFLEVMKAGEEERITVCNHNCSGGRLTIVGENSGTWVWDSTQFPNETPTMEVTWYSRKVSVFNGTIRELRKKIPYFRRDPFRVESEGTNPHLDIIVRKPLKRNQGNLLPRDDEVHVPIATVSKQYILVQHHKVLGDLEEALREKGIDTAHLEGELKLTEYGERMWASFTLPTHGFNPDVHTWFDPGDGYPVVLKVNVSNSVDKTAALEINLTWHRLVCKNGLIYGEDIDFRRIHREKSLNSGAIKEFLEAQLESEQVAQQKHRFEEWYATEIVPKTLSEEKPSPPQIEHWIDKVVAKEWNANAAARVYHIAKTGYDGNVTPFEKNVPPHEREVNGTSEVPGAFAPVRNAYDISQVLSWIAGHRGTLQEQLKWMLDIPYLMDALLKTEEPLTLQIDPKGSTDTTIGL